MQQFLSTTQETEHFGAGLYRSITPPCIVFLRGDLGAGKTTLVRGFLHAAGYSGTVKSPTYNLVEEYELPGRTIYHFDLYRLKDPEELEYLGINDYFEQNSICFIEWPDQGKGYLPAADIEIYLTVRPGGRLAETVYYCGKSQNH